MAYHEFHVVYNSEKTRRVTIFKTDSGGYSFEEEIYSSIPEEQCWFPQTHGRSTAICDSLEIAIREAIGRVPWLTISMIVDK
ncbi:MAG: hypothetical protein AB8C95_00995 [Phycisphaeraceae bacterium]